MCIRLLHSFRKDQSGAVLVEFAFIMPIFTMMGFTAIETANLVNTNTAVSQIAMTLADNLSRAKQDVGAGLSPQLREHDINDALEGVRLQAKNADLFANGRVIITSLQRVPDAIPERQWIAWQRCRGVLQVASEYGAEDQGRTGTVFPGITSEGGTIIKAPDREAIIFVEVSYNYNPLVGSAFLPARTLRHKASFYVRDDRDLGTGVVAANQNLNGMYNPIPQSKVRVCTQFTAT